MPIMTVDDAARRYAWTLGRSDYPALDRCPYNSARSFALFAAYWSGWRSHEEGARADEQPSRAA